MTMTKTDFNLKVNNSSSWIVYITKTYEETKAIHQTAMTQREMLLPLGWYYSVSTNEVRKDCRVPKFFHERGYYMTCIEHNNGDWSKDPTYTLYIVE